MIVMKKIVVLIYCLCLFSLIGCSYPSYKTYYTDVNKYEEIWSLTGSLLEYDEEKSLFPEKIENLETEEFFCRYDEQIPLGEGIQILLKLNFSNSEKFEAEIERIKDRAFMCQEYFGDFDLIAYATKLNDDNCEYVLINTNNQTINYIYLQQVRREEIEINENLLPNNYE